MVARISMKKIIMIMLVLCNSSILCTIEDTRSSMPIDISCIVSLADSLKALIITQEVVYHTINQSTSEQQDTCYAIRHDIEDYRRLIIEIIHNFVISVACMQSDLKELLTDTTLEALKCERKNINDVYKKLLSIALLYTKNLLLLEGQHSEAYQRNTQENEAVIDTITQQIITSYSNLATSINEQRILLSQWILSNIRTEKRYSSTVQSLLVQQQSEIYFLLQKCIQDVSDRLTVWFNEIQHHLLLMAVEDESVYKRETSRMCTLLDVITNDIIQNIQYIEKVIENTYSSIQRSIQEMRSSTLQEQDSIQSASSDVQSDIDKELCREIGEIELIIVEVLSGLQSMIASVNEEIVAAIDDYGICIMRVCDNVTDDAQKMIHELDICMIRDSNKYISASRAINMQAYALIEEKIAHIDAQIKELESVYIAQLSSVDADLIQQICGLLSTYERHAVTRINGNVRYIQSAFTLIIDLICQKITVALTSLTEDNLIISNLLSIMYANISYQIKRLVGSLSVQLIDTSSTLIGMVTIAQSNLQEEIVTSILHLIVAITDQNNQLLVKLSNSFGELQNLIGEQIHDHDVHMTEQYDHKCEQLMDMIAEENEGSQEIITRIMELQNFIEEDIDAFLESLDEVRASWFEETQVLLSEMASILSELAELVAEHFAEEAAAAA